ncbi:hypothetical protein JW756_06310 [Candidatus Woesearchaeota archaeon]|nr:hypothetical protein [Candidatus Woesearchaeota archaeon]
MLLFILSSCSQEETPHQPVYTSVCGDSICSADELGVCDIDCSTGVEVQPVVTTPADLLEQMRSRIKEYSPEERLNQTNNVVAEDENLQVESISTYVPVTGFRVASRYNLLSIGENISKVMGTLNKFYLREILMNGVLRSNTEAFGPRAALYEQFLKLRAGKVVFGFDEESETLSTYLHYNEGEPMLDYMLDLQGGIFKFFEGQSMHFLGHDYVISEVSNDSLKLVGLTTPDTFLFRNRHGAWINEKTISPDVLNVTLKKDSLRIIILADKDMNILPGTGLRSYVDEPETLLTNRLDIAYDGLTDVPVFDIKFDKSGEKYWLNFVTSKNASYKIPFAYLSPLKLGDDDNSLVFKEGTGSSDYFIKSKDYFVVNNNKQFNGLSNIIRLLDVKEENGLLLFEDPALEKFIVYFKGTPGANATADLIVDRVVHKVYVGKNHSIAVDLDGNSRINEDNTPIITAGNALIKVNQVYHDYINVSIITPKEMRENSNSNLEINFRISNDGLSIDKNDLEMLAEPSGANVLVGMTDYGTLFVLSKNVDEDDQSGDDLIIKYPLVQRFADVVVMAYE